MTCDLRFVPAALDFLTAINNDVKLDETRTIFCMTNKSPLRFERINKLGCLYSYWQIFHFVYSLKHHVTLLLYHQSLSACKDDGYRGESMNEVCFFAGDKAVSS